MIYFQNRMKFRSRLFLLLFVLTVLLVVLFFQDVLFGQSLIPIHSILNVTDLVNEHNYTIVINPHLAQCTQGDQLLLIAIVFVAPQFFDRRKLIRETWASVNDSRLLVLFALGLSQDRTVNDLVYQESTLFNDIVQEDFIDNYKNLTLKTMMSLKWISNYCNNTRYILRINDDVVVNVPYLLKHLQESPSQTNNILGNYYSNSKIDRRPGAKFYISHEQYNQSRYYPYCEGSAYILSQDLAKSIYELSRYVRWEPFSSWLEDVYLGMLAAYLNVTFVQYSQHFSSTVQYSYTTSAHLKRWNRKKLFFVYVKDPLKDMKPIWHILSE